MEGEALVTLLAKFGMFSVILIAFKVYYSDQKAERAAAWVAITALQDRSTAALEKLSDKYEKIIREIQGDAKEERQGHEREIGLITTGKVT